jgi:putative membrane protein
MTRLIVDVLVTAGLLFALASALPGVRLKSYGTAVIVAVVYGLLNYFLFWLIALVAFIPMLLSLGLFGLVINAFLLWLTDILIEDFEIDSVKTTLIMAVLLTVGKFILSVLLNALM